MNSEKGKRQKKRLIKSNIYFEVFIGSYINVILKNVKMRNPNSKNIVNAMFAGILLETDDDNIYLGNDQGEINLALSKNDIAATFCEDNQIEEIPFGTVRQ